MKESIFLLLLVLSHGCLSQPPYGPEETCKIVQYSNHTPITDHTVETSAGGYHARLTCKCNVDTPHWTVEYLNSLYTYTKESDVLCHSTNDDGCSDTALFPASNTKYLYNDIPHNIVNETTIFKCHTSDNAIFAEPLIVLVQEPASSCSMVTTSTATPASTSSIMATATITTTASTAITSMTVTSTITTTDTLDIGTTATQTIIPLTSTASTESLVTTCHPSNNDITIIAAVVTVCGVIIMALLAALLIVIGFCCKLKHQLQALRKQDHT